MIGAWDNMDTILFAVILMSVITNTAILTIALHAITHCNITVTTATPALPTAVYANIDAIQKEMDAQQDKDNPATFDEVVAAVNAELFGGTEDGN